MVVLILDACFIIFYYHSKSSRRLLIPSRQPLNERASIQSKFLKYPVAHQKFSMNLLKYKQGVDVFFVLFFLNSFFKIHFMWAYFSMYHDTQWEVVFLMKPRTKINDRYIVDSAMNEWKK